MTDDRFFRHGPPPEEDPEIWEEEQDTTWRHDCEQVLQYTNDLGTVEGHFHSVADSTEQAIQTGMIHFRAQLMWAGFPPQVYASPLGPLGGES